MSISQTNKRRTLIYQLSRIGCIIYVFSSSMFCVYCSFNESVFLYPVLMGTMLGTPLFILQYVMSGDMIWLIEGKNRNIEDSLPETASDISESEPQKVSPVMIGFGILIIVGLLAFLLKPIIFPAY
jgi:hypothetical protein